MHIAFTFSSTVGKAEQVEALRCLHHLLCVVLPTALLLHRSLASEAGLEPSMHLYAVAVTIY